MLSWGPWRPDALGPNTGACVTATGVIPFLRGKDIAYRPAPGFVTPGGSSALSGAPRGSISVLMDDGTNQVFYATASTIEKMSVAYGWTSIDTGLSVTAGDDMSFAKLGQYLLNTNTTDGFKAYNVETPAGNNAVSGAPSARRVCIIGNVVFGLDCDGNNRRMESSAIGNHTNWSTQGADGKTFEYGGALIEGVDLKNGYGLFMHSQAMSLVHVGDPATSALYSIQKVADGRGSVGYRSVVAFDGTCFFLATDGFYRFDLNNGNVNIGASKVNNWFLADIDNSRLDEVQATVDPKNTIVLWRYFSSANPSTTVADKIIGYHWVLNEWFLWEVNTAWLSRIATPGYTTDDLDTIFATVDSSDMLLDDRFFQGGQFLLAGLDSDFKPAVFSGSAMAATLQANGVLTGTRRLSNAVMPISSNRASTIQLGVQNLVSDAITWKDPVSRSTRTDIARLRGSGRILHYRENHAAGDSWTYSQGVDFADEKGMGL